MSHEYLSPTEFMALTRVSRPTIYRLLNEGPVQALKLGRTWRIPRTELERLKTKPAAQVDQPIPTK